MNECVCGFYIYFLKLLHFHFPVYGIVKNFVFCVVVVFDLDFESNDRN